MIPTSAALKGQLAEILFMKKVTELGGLVSKPIHSDSQYDFITDFDSSLKRVQIKSTWMSRVAPDNSTYFLLKAAYSPQQVDFIVCYVQPTNTWYIIPIADLSSSYIKINSESAYNKFKENWSLLYENS